MLVCLSKNTSEKGMDYGIEEVMHFDNIKDALDEAEEETSSIKSFELYTDLWKSFHMAGIKRDNGYIDWKSIMDD